MSNQIQSQDLQMKRMVTYTAFTMMLAMFTWCMPQSVIAEEIDVSALHTVVNSICVTDCKK